MIVIDRKGHFTQFGKILRRGRDDFENTDDESEDHEICSRVQEARSLKFSDEMQTSNISSTLQRTEKSTTKEILVKPKKDEGGETKENKLVGNPKLKDETIKTETDKRSQNFQPISAVPVVLQVTSVLPNPNKVVERSGVGGGAE
eukprot:746129-Hanusia_phi.AAC.2